MVASTPGQTIGVNVFTDKLIAALDLTRTEVSLSYLIGTTASGFLLIFAGKLYDIIGSRRLIVAASLGLGASLFYMSYVDVIPNQIVEFMGDETLIWRLYMIALTIGFFLIRFTGQGFVTMAGRNMVGKWWKYHRGKVLPYSGICVSVCFSLAPNVFNFLIEQFDWRGAWQILGGATIAYAIWGWLVFRDNPEECGLDADAGIPPGETQKDDPEFSVVKDLNRSEALKTFGFYVFCGIFGLQALFYTAYAFHVVSIAAEIGVTKGRILDLFIIIAIAGGAISIAVGWLSDKYKLKYFAAFMAGGIALSSAALLIKPQSIMLPMLILGMSITSGSFGSVSGAFLPRYFGVKHLGAISGIFMSNMIIASAIGPYLFSQLRDVYATYDPAYGATLAIAAALLISSFWANNPQRKLKAQRETFQA